MRSQDANFHELFLSQYRTISVFIMGFGVGKRWLNPFLLLPVHRNPQELKGWRRYIAYRFPVQGDNDIWGFSERGMERERKISVKSWEPYHPRIQKFTTFPVCLMWNFFRFDYTPRDYALSVIQITYSERFNPQPMPSYSQTLLI